MTIGELGEFGLIARVTGRIGPAGHVELGPGDDSAVVTAPDGRVVASTDMYLEGSHFRRDWSTATDIGHRVAAACLADIAAMGARATALLVGFGAPPDLEASWSDELMQGLLEECTVAGAAIVGGDVVRSDKVILALTALGDLGGRAPVTRGGARDGDVVAVRGRLGWSAAGLAVLSHGFRSPRVLVDAHRRPVPPYAAGPEAADAGATAMCDVSDGLVQDLGHLAAAGGVAIDVTSAAFEVPEPFEQVAAALGGADPLSWILAGGEDHALAATFPGEVGVPEGWLVVGRVSAGEGVTVDGATYEGTGWDSFAD
ncbi:MAG: thiamine-phosphate kinase [Streptosporangiales bacterium]|nr:thiamine-phosphate kinase [Streptosporangiales bacterium]